MTLQVMQPETAVIEVLANVTDVAAIVSDRIRTNKLSQHEILPAIRVVLVGELTETHLRGGSSHGRARVQIDAYAAEAPGMDPYAEASDLGAAIHGDGAGGALEGFRGAIGGSPDPGFFIEAIFRQDRSAFYDPDDRRTVRVRQDYFVWYHRIGGGP